MSTYPPGGLQTPFVGSTELLAAQLNKILDAFNAMFFLGFVGYASGYSGTTTENLLNGIWLEMNGVAVSRTTYADLNTLYSGAGYPFGSGDGSTTFNLPPAPGRGLIHHPGSGGNSHTKTLGANDGLALASRTTVASISGASAPSLTGSIGGTGSVVVFPSGSTSVLTGVGNGSLAISGGGGGGGTVTEPFLVAGIYVVKAFA